MRSIILSVKYLLKIPNLLIILLIDIYSVCISPYTRPSCRFYPTCSQYARQSFIQYGLIKGTFLTFKRVFRCHPFSDGGYDPLPDPNRKS